LPACLLLLPSTHQSVNKQTNKTATTTTDWLIVIVRECQHNSTTETGHLKAGQQQQAHL